MQVTNGRKAAHTIFTKAGPVRIKPGETREVDISAEEAKDVAAAGLQIGGRSDETKPAEPASAEEIVAAIELLDASNDDHWTAGGLPAVDAVAEIAGKSLTRKAIEAAAPDARRPEPKPAE